MAIEFYNSNQDLILYVIIHKSGLDIIRYHIILYHAITLLALIANVSANHILVCLVANQSLPVNALRACVLV